MTTLQEIINKHVTRWQKSKSQAIAELSLAKMRAAINRAKIEFIKNKGDKSVRRYI